MNLTKKEDRNVRINLTLRHVCVIIVGVGNKITNSGCTSVALGILHAKRMRRIILLYAACLTVPYFSTLSRKRQY
jgi:hypothetical protein